MQDLDRIVADALQQFTLVREAPELERVKARFLGKEGALTALLKGLGKLAPDERREAGSRINTAKDRIEAALDSRRAAIERRHAHHLERAGQRAAHHRRHRQELLLRRTTAARY